MKFVNIAFSSKGLKKVRNRHPSLHQLTLQLGATDDIKDDGFTAGMLPDAESLGDDGKSSNGKFEPDWLPDFERDIDGVVLVAGHNHHGVKEQLDEVLAILQHSVREVFNIFGHVRPGKEDSHEQ